MQPKMQSPFEFAIVTGFGDKGITELGDSLQRIFPDASFFVIPGCPVEKAEEEPDILIENIRSELHERTQQFVLVGHSYGALLALTAACREKLAGILRIILIDGPLHPHVEVEPVNGFLQLFQVQYRNRVRLALECLETLPYLERERVITIGTQRDRIVPGAAKSLPGICHIELPETYSGHDLDSKISIITNLIRTLVGG